MFVMILLIGGIISVGYITIVIKELKLKIESSQLSLSSIKMTDSILEKDSEVYQDDLKSYLLFAKNINKEEYLNELTSKRRIEKVKNRFYINENIELASLESNECDRFRCIQIKKKFHEIPSSLWKALLGTEDFRFLDHRGVDIIAIGRAIIIDIVAMKFVQGGSTLTQQLVKNLFLSNEKKISRKIKEMVYAIYIENIMEKEEIIELYLNEVFWGTFQGVYLKGFYAASVAYFKKVPSELTDYEATILISLLKGPNYYAPAKNHLRLKQRVAATFERLQSLKLFSENSLIWNDKNWEDFSVFNQNNTNKNYFYNFYVLSKNHEIKFESFDKFVLYNSIDRVKERLQKRIKDVDISIKVLVEDQSCDDFDCENMFSHYSKMEREKRAAIVDERHQIGSLLKPIIYDSFIELGRSYDESVSTEDLEIKLKSGIWHPKDYSKTKDSEVSLKVALQKSKNIPLIRIANEIGFDELEKNIENKIPGLIRPLREYPAQLLGSLELSLEEIFKTYKKFVLNKCESIVNGDLKLEESVLYYMSKADETTISGMAVEPYRNALIFGKTGTSNNGLDNWYFAFDGRTYYTIWFGVDSERQDKNLRLTGANSAFAIFQDFINHRGKQITEIHCE